MPRALRIWNWMTLKVPGFRSLAYRWCQGHLCSHGNAIFAVTYYIQYAFKTDLWSSWRIQGREYTAVKKTIQVLGSTDLHLKTSFQTALSQFGKQAGRCHSHCQWTTLWLERAMHDHTYCSIDYFFLNCPEILERKQASVLTEELSVNSHFSHGAN